MKVQKLDCANDAEDWPATFSKTRSKRTNPAPGRTDPETLGAGYARGGSAISLQDQLVLPSSLEAEIAFANNLREQIAFFDSHWTLLAVNRAWADAARGETFPTFGPGSNYLEFSEQLANQGDEAARATAEELRRIDAGEIDRFDQVDSGARARKGHIYQTRIYAFGANREWRAVARYDMTELITLKQQKRRLGSQLLTAEADERRRVARDLHDTTAQDLASLQLSLAILKRGRSPPVEETFADADKALDRLQREIRALSYLFHSPWAEGKGLAKSLEEMVHGFARRSGLEISLVVDDVEAVDGRLGMAAHRLVQEALANVQRHAKATKVEVRLISTEHRLHIMIRDDGTGIVSRVGSPGSVGVGLRSMRDRVEEFGGSFTLRSGASGTTILANLPLQDDRASEAELDSPEE